MKKIYILMTAIAILSTLFLVIKYSSSGNTQLLGPGFQRMTSLSSPTPAPPQAPKTFKFDRSTDLKKELDSINPQVLDSDFE